MSTPETVPYAQADFSGYQRQQDSSHLNLLMVFHFVWGGVLALFSLFPLIHVGMGIMLVTGQFNQGTGQGPPAAFGWIFIIFGGVAILIGEIVAGLNIYNAVQIKRRRSRIFSIVISALNCAFMPFGTILGIFTIIVLLRESVKAAYESPASA